MNRLQQLEVEMIELAGPLGRFVIKKQMKELNMSEADANGPMFFKLMDLCISNSVFDPTKRDEAMKKLKRKFSNIS